MSGPVFAGPVASDGLTIRQQCVEQVLGVLRGMEDGTPPVPVWMNVLTGDISEVENQRAPFVTLDEGEERVFESYGGCTTKELSLIVSFRWRHAKGLDPLSYYKYYLGMLQKALLPMHEQEELYPHIGDMREESNYHSSLGQDDEQPGGTLILILQYRHATHNPYLRAGER